MKKVQVAILAAAICLTAAGCGNTLQKSANPSASIYNYKEQSITMQSQPKRIVTLSAPLLNMAYAIGGTSLARPTTSSPIPDSAKALPELGQVSHINMEKLVELNPDLVLGEKGQNGKLESLLQSNKIPYLLINYDGINDNNPLMKFLGQVYGRPEQADKIIKKYEADIQKVEKDASQYVPAKIAILRATGKAVTAETPKSICASMAERLKMNNVLLSHKEINLDTKTVPYSLEQLSADDPEIIFVVTMGKAEEINKKMDEQMRDNPAWANIQAVKNNRVYFLPSDLFLMNPGVNTPKAMNQLLDLAYHQ